MSARCQIPTNYNIQPLSSTSRRWYQHPIFWTFIALSRLFKIASKPLRAVDLGGTWVKFYSCLCLWEYFARRPEVHLFKPLPKAIINPRNFDNNCFQYSILAAVHPATTNLNNPYTYTKYLSELDMTGIETPVSLSSIPKFESQNTSISVNVLVYEKKDLIPVYTSKFLNERPHHINLLLLTKGDKFHYTLIKSLSCLLGDKTKHHPRGSCLYVLSTPICIRTLSQESSPRMRSASSPDHRVSQGGRQHFEIWQNSARVSRPVCFICRLWILPDFFRRTRSQ